MASAYAALITIARLGSVQVSGGTPLAHQASRARCSDGILERHHRFRTSTLPHSCSSQRILKGISQEDLAHKADINRTSLSELEKDASYPGLEIIAKLATVLDVELQQLRRRLGRQPPLIHISQHFQP